MLSRSTSRAIDPVSLQALQGLLGGAGGGDPAPGGAASVLQ